MTEADFEVATGHKGDSVGPLVGPSVGSQEPLKGISESQKPNKKRALMALGSLLMILGIHPPGFEPGTFGSVDANVVDATTCNGKTLPQNTPAVTVNEQYANGNDSHLEASVCSPSAIACNSTAEAPQLDDDLCRIITAWSSLPKLARQSITIIVDTAIQSIASQKSKPKRPSVQRRKDGGH